MKPEGNPLQLEVSNFGPIAKANIDLRPLTVFVGPSNTGKSYLAILIYALHKHFGAGNWISREYFPGRLSRYRRSANHDLSPDDINALAHLAEHISMRDKESGSIENFPLSPSIIELIRSSFNDWGYHVSREIIRCFGLEEAGDLIRNRISSSAHVTIHQYGSKSAHIQHQLTIKARSDNFKTTVSGDVRIEVGRRNNNYGMRYLLRSALEMTLPRYEDEEQLDFYFWRFREGLVNYVRPQIVGSFALPAFYLPADRTGVMHAHSVVVSSLIDRATMSGIRPAAQLPMLSGVLADFLEQLIELEPRRSSRRRYPNDHAAQIEKAMLGGSVAIERAEASGYPRFTYRPEGWDHSLPLMNASSMVSELAPVVLYLRHLVHPGTVLIVEEPESHLHPALQVEFTRQLARLVQSGVRVVITTHSEWVLEELANIVRRSALVGKQDKTASGSDISLRPDQVGAWLFRQKKRPKGSVVEELILDDDTGLYSTDYDVVSEALYNEGVEISRHLQTRKGQ